MVRIYYLNAEYKIHNNALLNLKPTLSKFHCNECLLLFPYCNDFILKHATSIGNKGYCRILW